MRGIVVEAAVALAIAVGSVQGHTFCARAINNHRYSLCPLDVLTSPETTDDPIRCIDEPEGYRSDFMSLAEWRWNGDCVETQLIDEIPQGFNSSVAVECGQIPTEDEEWLPLLCYYDQITEEFCGSTTGSEYQCFPLDSKAAFLTVDDGSCEFLTEVKAGKCDEDVTIPRLEEPEINDDYLNGYNRRVLEARHPCSFVNTGSQLDIAGATDDRSLRFEYVFCASSAAAPEKCSEVETFELQGKRLLEVGNMLVQRQGDKTDNLCFLFQKRATLRDDCETRCFHIERNRGIQREISVNFLAIDADNWFSEEVYFKILDEDKRGSEESFQKEATGQRTRNPTM